MSSQKPFFLVAVHGGAGYHDLSHEKQVKQALRFACSKALRRLQDVGCTAVEAAEEAIATLEDDECLNAGYGSNLTIDGEVECDSAIMDGTSLSFGSVGAVSGVKNPIRAARAVMDYSSLSDGLGRVPPMTLVSFGARQFASSRGCEMVQSGMSVSPRARKEWEKWKQRLENVTPGDALVVRGSEDMHHQQDTVGAVALDAAENLAAGVSSGGLLLKLPGRIGEAAIFGAGCWAQNVSTDPISNNGMACSISGSGEHIIRSSMAQSLCSEYYNSAHHDTHLVLENILTKFLNDSRTTRDNERDAGVLMLTIERDEHDSTLTPRLWCGFTAKSMAIAYATSVDMVPKTRILRRPTAAGAGQGNSSIVIHGISLSGP